MMHESNPSFVDMMHARAKSVEHMDKYDVHLNDEKVAMIYARTEEQALEIAVKTHGLDCDVTRST